MTVTSSSSGAPRARRTRRLRVRVAALIAATALLIAPWGSAGAFAADATPSPSPSPTLTGDVSVVLAPVDSGVVRSGEPLNAWVSLTNGTGRTVGATTVSLALGTGAIRDRAALGTWLASTANAGGMTEVATAQLDAAPSGTEQQKLLLVSAEDPSIAGRAPGIYPLQATFTSGTGSWTSHSVMIVPDTSATTTPVGLVVPITAGPLTTGLLTADQLTTLTGPDGALTAQLHAVDGSSAILAIDPAIPAAIRVLGSSAPQSATDWLDLLMSLPNERFALQFGDADTALQTQTDHTSLLSPLSLQSYMNEDDFLPTGGDQDETTAPTASPTATTAPDQPVYPDMQTLLDIGPHTRGAVYWPFTGTAGSADVTTLGKLSSGDAAALTLVPSATTSAGAGGAAVPARGHVGDAGVLVYDSAVSAQLQAASTQSESSLRGAALTAAAAYLTFAARSADGAPLLVVADRTADRAALGLDGVLGAMSRVPGTRAASLAQLDSAGSSAVTVADAAAAPERVIAIGALENREHELTSFSSILDDPDVLTGPERAEILQLLGGGWIDDDTAWKAAFAAHSKASATTLSAVDIAPTSAVNLVGSAAPLRFWVRNDLPWPVNVELLAQPNDLRLEVQQNTAVVAQPRSNTRVEVPVQAKIGNGEVSIALQLRSPTYVRIGTQQTVDVNVRADWEAVGLTVLGLLVGGFLVLGLVRTIQGRRRARAAAAAEPDSADPPDGDRT